jgi:drug/metabolite transporter (DMT)-like permease
VVVLLTIGADVLLGIGWVLQHEIAARTRGTHAGPWRMLMRLVRSGTWWAGIGAMAGGQTLAAWALQSGSVTFVEPMLAGCLVCAFGFARLRGDEPFKVGEVLGTAVVVGGVALFLAAASPDPKFSYRPAILAAIAATAAVGTLAAVIVLLGRAVRDRSAALESAAFAAAAGALYALQDAATRGSIQTAQQSFAAMIHSAWPYVVLGGATAGVLISQAAFRAARLDWSLPPVVAVQPLVGVGLGVGLLDDQLRVSPGALALEALSIPLTLIGVIIVGRSGVLRCAHEPRGSRPREVETAPRSA